MQSKKTFAVKSLLSCLVVNSLFLVPFFIMAKQVLASLHQWLSPVAVGAGPALPADAQAAFAGLNRLIGETELYLPMVVFGLGLTLTLLLWLVLQAQARRLLALTEEETMASHPAVSAAAEEAATAAVPPAPPLEVPQALPASPQTAVQMLAILQREGRLVDFLQEDLRPYSDDQIGAAVRSIHQGCQTALLEHLDLKPIVEDTEGAEITIPPDFDANAIRLTGNVSGDPPFKGILRHHGWRVMRLDLPQVTAPQQKGWILAPAEVEIPE